MESEIPRRDTVEPPKIYTSLPLLTGTRDASVPINVGLESVVSLENCVCKENLKKYTTVPLIGIALLLLANTAITVTRNRGSTSVNVCRNFTLPIGFLTSPTSRAVEVEKRFNETTVKFQGPATDCLSRHALHLGEDIYASVCNVRGSVRLDIRRFIDQPPGLLPTVRGIFLSPRQWNVLKNNVDFIDFAVKSRHDDDLP